MPADAVPFVIAPGTRLGPVHLIVADVQREAGFYRGVLGFRTRRETATEVVLGTAGEDLLFLTERPGAERAGRTTGLYHFCVLVPRRWDLARLLASLKRNIVPIQGMVNHWTHLAIYLTDPEGNGVELAWDFPKEAWPPVADLLRLGNGPLEAEELLAEIRDDEAAPPDLDPLTHIGHIHLRVADLGAAFAFYHGFLGFEETIHAVRMGAGFVAAGGYHHHIAFNVWATQGAPPAPPGSLGLQFFTVILPLGADLAEIHARLLRFGVEVKPDSHGERVSDPAGNWVLLTAQNV